jgi:phage terminase small subunit
VNIIEPVKGSRKYDEAVKSYTPLQLKKYKKVAKEYYQSQNGEVSVKVLSRVAKVPQSYIRQWMAEESWDSNKEDKGDKVKLSDKTRVILQSSAEQYGLTEQEELFCYHYLKTFNATTSAIRAGYSSSSGHQQAYKLLKDEKVKNFLYYIKGQRNEELFLDSMRVIQEYIKIAFADMTDFVKFGPNGVVLKSSDKVDGQMIVKVKEGRDGVSIELADKLKAMEKLEKFLNVMPNDWRQKLEEKKVGLMEEKLKLEKEKLNGGTDEPDDDGFLEALGLSTKEVWGDGHNDEDEED